MACDSFPHISVLSLSCSRKGSLLAKKQTPFNLVSSYISDSSQESNWMLWCLISAFHNLFSFKFQNVFLLTGLRCKGNMLLTCFPAVLWSAPDILKPPYLFDFHHSCNHFYVLNIHSQGLSTLPILVTAYLSSSALLKPIYLQCKSHSQRLETLSPLKPQPE